MARKSYVYDPEKGELVPKEEYQAPASRLIVMPDIPDFVSPVDGSIVHGRKSLREHNKQHGVTNSADFKETWEKQANERAKAYTPGSRYDSERRKEQIHRSIERLRRG